MLWLLLILSLEDPATSESEVLMSPTKIMLVSFFPSKFINICFIIDIYISSCALRLLLLYNDSLFSLHCFWLKIYLILCKSRATSAFFWLLLAWNNLLYDFPSSVLPYLKMKWVSISYCSWVLFILNPLIHSTSSNSRIL